MWNHSDKELSNTLHLKEESCAVFNVHRYRLFMMSVIMKECEPKNKSSPMMLRKPKFLQSIPIRQMHVKFRRSIPIRQMHVQN